MSMRSNIEISNLRNTNSLESKDFTSAASEADVSQFRLALARQTALLSSGPERTEGIAPVSSLNMCQGGGSANVGQQILDQFFQKAAESRQNSAKLKEELTAVGKTGNPLDLVNVELKMNKQIVEEQMMAKVISKTASSLDQLTKMQ